MSSRALFHALVAAMAVAAPLALTMPATAARAVAPGVNGQLAFDHGDNGVFVANPDGSDAHELVPAGCCAGWSPDGSHLVLPALLADGRFTFSVVNADGSGLTVMPIDDPTLWVGADTWSPDGQWVLGPGGDETNPSRDGIYIRRASDGSAIRQVYHNPSGGPVQIGDFSPDGGQIAFVAYQGATEDSDRAIFVVNRDGSRPRQITPWGMAGCCTASWSPDGRWIVFDARGKLFIVHPDGSGMRQVRLHPGSSRYVAYEPTWSPDGHRIAFTMYVYALGQDDIYTSRLDGTGLVQVTNTPGHEGQVDWGTHVP